MQLTDWPQLPHAHQCSCGHTWAHDPRELCKRHSDLGRACDNTIEMAEIAQSQGTQGPLEQAYQRAHDCPKCGRHVTHCQGDIVPAEIWTGDEHLPWVP